jgi:hypothetical protein
MIVIEIGREIVIAKRIVKKIKIEIERKTKTKRKIVKENIIGVKKKEIIPHVEDLPRNEIERKNVKPLLIEERGERKTPSRKKEVKSQQNEEKSVIVGKILLRQ